MLIYFKRMDALWMKYIDLDILLYNDDVYLDGI